MYEPKSFADMFAPKFDVGAIAAMQKRNLDAFNAVGSRLAEGAQAFLKRQAEMVQIHLSDHVSAAKEALATTDAQAGIEKQFSFAQTQTKKAIAETQELASIVSSTANETLEILRKHTEDGVAAMSSKLS